MEQQGREIFLREFVRTVIKQIPPKKEWAESSYLINLPRRANIVPNQPVVQLRKPILQKQPIPQRMPIPAHHLPAQQVKKTISAKPAVLQTPLQTEKETSPILPKSGAKIVNILRDPSVIGIECPGADKNILVNRAGNIQPAQTKLSAAEIKDVLEEISSETKIPLISGIFKAVYKSLVVTAVISEFVGSRFIMEKRPKAVETPIKR